ncbi:MAG: GH92 family glycosyl hydrolase [Rikenellaceae bacterium]
MKFIKSTSFIYSLSVLLAAACATQEHSPIDYVDPFMGSATDYGQLDPSATVPFGMIKVCPDAAIPTHVGYDYENDLISGVSITRLGGVGGSGAGGNISVRPASPECELSIVKSSEYAEPGFYSANLSNGVKIELTATEKIALQRYVFTEDATANIFVDLTKSFDDLIAAEYTVVSDSEISGVVKAKNTCGYGAYTICFDLASSVPFTVIDSTAQTLLLEMQQREVEIRIAISSVSEQMAAQRQAAISAVSFDQVRSEAKESWNDILSIVDVKGGSKEQRTIFYTLLYRCFQAPVKVADKGESYIDTKGEVQVAEDFAYYSSWSIWDTFRTKLPLLSLLTPDVMSDAAQSLMALYNSGKENWSTPHEAFPTVRTEHASVILLDAYNKGIKNIDLSKAYEAIKQDTIKLPLKSPDNKLETAYDMWALSQIAAIVGDECGAAKYAQRSDSLWSKVWVEKFKDIDHDTFDVMYAEGMYQGTLWQYRWAVPFALDQASELVGGKEQLAKELDYFFENDLYNHGNQPDIHAPFIFNVLGAPHRTQYWVNQLTSKPFVHTYGSRGKAKEPFFGMTYKVAPRAFIPEMDDDYGTMSAWYVAAAIGLYPLLPGSNIYQITTPLFEEVVLNLAGGAQFKIVCKNFSAENIYIKQITLNGKPYEAFEISNQEIMKGGVLELTLCDQI